MGKNQHYKLGLIGLELLENRDAGMPKSVTFPWENPRALLSEHSGCWDGCSDLPSWSLQECPLQSRHLMLMFLQTVPQAVQLGLKPCEMRLLFARLPSPLMFLAHIFSSSG